MAGLRSQSLMKGSTQKAKSVSARLVANIDVGICCSGVPKRYIHVMHILDSNKHRDRRSWMDMWLVTISSKDLRLRSTSEARNYPNIAKF